MIWKKHYLEIKHRNLNKNSWKKNTANNDITVDTNSGKYYQERDLKVFTKKLIL